MQGVKKLMLWNNYQVYRTNTFQEIWDNADKFVQEYQNNGITATISEASCRTLYYLLYAKYGNSPIAASDENRFKYEVWSTIFKYGPAWEKRLEIQDKLRNLSEDELLKGSKAIYNHAFNPGTAPAVGTLEELPAINEQNSTNFKKSKLEAYAMLMQLLQTDVTEEFLAQFAKLFRVFLLEDPLTYITELKGGEIQ